MSKNIYHVYVDAIKIRQFILLAVNTQSFAIKIKIKVTNSTQYVLRLPKFQPLVNHTFSRNSFYTAAECVVAVSFEQRNKQKRNRRHFENSTKTRIFKHDIAKKNT